MRASNVFLIVVLVLIILVMGACAVANPPDAGEYRSSGHLSGSSIGITGPITGTSATVSGPIIGTSLTVGGAGVFTGTLRADQLTTLNYGLVHGRFSRSTAYNTATVTNGVAFAAGGTYQPITAASAVTPTMTIPATGSWVCLENVGTNAITLVDTGNQVLSANAVLGQYDMLCVISDGTRVIEITRSDN